MLTMAGGDRWWGCTTRARCHADGSGNESPRGEKMVRDGLRSPRLVPRHDRSRDQSREKVRRSGNPVDATAFSFARPPTMIKRHSWVVLDERGAIRGVLTR